VQKKLIFFPHKIIKKNTNYKKKKKKKKKEEQKKRIFLNFTGKYTYTHTRTHTSTNLHILTHYTHTQLEFFAIYSPLFCKVLK
jgi:hypothetical protein